MYREPVFKSLSHLHTEYKHLCAEHDIEALSRQVFSSLFNNLNLPLFHLKKDQCNTCCTFRARNTEAATWEEHCIKKDMAQAMKQRDKEEAGEKALVASMYLQELLLCPKFQVSALSWLWVLIILSAIVFY